MVECESCARPLTADNVRTKGDSVCHECCNRAYDAWRAQGSPAADEATATEQEQA